MGGKGKKRDETGRKSASEASRVVNWGGGKTAELRNPHPPQTPSLSSLAGFFRFCSDFVAAVSIWEMLAATNAR